MSEPIKRNASMDEATEKMKDEPGESFTKDLILLARELMELVDRVGEVAEGERSEQVSVIGGDLMGLIDKHTGCFAEDVLAE